MSKSGDGFRNEVCSPFFSQSPSQPSFHPSISSPGIPSRRQESIYSFACSVVAPCLSPLAHVHSPTYIAHQIPKNLIGFTQEKSPLGASFKQSVIRFVTKSIASSATIITRHGELNGNSTYALLSSDSGVISDFSAFHSSSLIVISP